MMMRRYGHQIYKTSIQLKCLGKMIRDDEIGSELCEQEEGTTAVASIATKASPDEEVEEIHRQAGQEDEQRPVDTSLHPPEIEADGRQAL